MNTFQEEFIAQSIFRLDENPPRIKKCFALLTEEQIWQRPNGSSNSIGNLILHLCGNIRQYAISSLGDKPDIRRRDQEFDTKGGYPKEELFYKFNKTIEEAKATILGIEGSDWLRNRTVQGFDLSGIGILIHVVEHLSYHVGQIAFYTKQLKNEQLGFYADVDLTVKND